jgi:Flp pilus assembly CpaF family ATPase
VRLVAHHVGVEVHSGSPRVSAELPESGERFEGLVPPVVAAHASPFAARPSRSSPSATMPRPASAPGRLSGSRRCWPARP